MLGETQGYRFTSCQVASDMRKTMVTVITKAPFPPRLHFGASLGWGCLSMSYSVPVITSRVMCKPEVHAEVYRAILCTCCCNYSRLGEKLTIDKGQRLICSSPPPPCPLLPALATLLQWPGWCLNVEGMKYMPSGSLGGVETAVVNHRVIGVGKDHNGVSGQ